MGYDRWECFAPQGAHIDRLGRDGYLPLAAHFLAARGLASAREAAQKLRGDISGLHDPFLLCDMQPAVDRIRAALEGGETIAVYGDYDADGITASALLLRELRRLGADTLWYIPDRVTEGYGLNRAGLETLAAGGASLVITVDTGSNAGDEAALCKELQMDLIITDHHECRDPAPDALAFINPHRPGSRYPFDGLAGVGVAFKLLCAVTGDAEKLLSRYGDLVALGTVADVMPVLDENRVMITYGLRVLENTQNPGLSALLHEPEAAGKPVDASLISYTLAPRVNAAGRLGRAGDALALLLADDPATAAGYARTLCDLNAERQILERGMLETALEAVDPAAPAILAESASFHIGIAGIVASRLAVRYGRPVFMICVEGDESRGSARSAPGVNLVEILGDLSKYLTAFGGHEQAAGFSLMTRDIPPFREAVLNRARQLLLTAESTLSVDGEVRPEWIDLPGIGQLESLSPFGPGFQPPVFCLKDAFILSVKPLSGGKHIRLNIEKDGVALEAVWFGHAISDGLPQELCEVAFRPEINRFRSRGRVQLHIVDMRPSAWHQEATRQFGLYRRFSAGEALAPEDAALLLPGRGDMAAVWRAMGRLKLPEAGVTPIWLARRLTEGGCPETAGRAWVSLDVLCEMKLCARQSLGGSRFMVFRRQGQDKIDLGRSELLRRLRALAGGQ